MSIEEISERHGAVIDTDLGVCFDPLDAPIPHRGEVIEPVVQLSLLARCQFKFYLALDHVQLSQWIFV